MSDDERTTALLEDLRELGEPDRDDQPFRAELASLLLARASAEPRALRPVAPPARRRSLLRVRPAAALAAAVAAAAGVTSFVLAGHRSASAEALLRRVAAASFEPNQARHLVYDVTMTLTGHLATGTGEIWFATDASGKPVRSSETLRLAKFAGAPTLVVERDVQTGAGVFTYDGTHQAIVVPSRNYPGWSSRETPTLPLPAYLFDGTTTARRLADLAANGAAHVRLLDGRVIDGVRVDVVQIDGWPNGASIRTTLYFDAGSHLLRGFDSRGTDPSYDSPAWRVRLARQTSGPSGTAPRDAFSLNAPASAQVQPPPPAPSALLRTCGSEPKLLLSRGESLLAACRAATPALTEDALVNALVGTARQDLAAAVAAGQITESQARAALLAQRAEILTMVRGKQPLKLPAQQAPGK